MSTYYGYTARLKEDRSKIYCFFKNREKFCHIDHSLTNEEIFEYNHPEFELAQAIIYDFGEETAKRIAKTLLASVEDCDKKS